MVENLKRAVLRHPDIIQIPAPPTYDDANSLHLKQNAGVPWSVGNPGIARNVADGFRKVENPRLPALVMPIEGRNKGAERWRRCRSSIGATFPRR